MCFMCSVSEGTVRSRVGIFGIPGFSCHFFFGLLALLLSQKFQINPSLSGSISIDRQLITAIH